MIIVAFSWGLRVTRLMLPIMFGLRTRDRIFLEKSPVTINIKAKNEAKMINLFFSSSRNFSCELAIL